MEPIVHRLAIPGWFPTLDNQLLRVHWYTRSRLKKKDAQRVALEAIAQGIPKARHRRRVSLVLQYPTGVTRCDPTAPLKSLLDALVKAGLLVDDSDRWLELGGVRYEVADQRGVVIELEDLT